MQSVLKKSGHMEMAVFALAVLAFALFYLARNPAACPARHRG